MAQTAEYVLLNIFDGLGQKRLLGEGVSDYRVFLDGLLVVEGIDIDAGVAYDVDVLLGPDARFLTLTATDGTVDSYFADRIAYGNPQLKLVTVPEPATMALLGLGIACIGRGRRKRFKV